jgi:hypothetical protein
MTIIKMATRNKKITIDFDSSIRMEPFEVYITKEYNIGIRQDTGISQEQDAPYVYVNPYQVGMLIECLKKARHKALQWLKETEQKTE